MTSTPRSPLISNDASAGVPVRLCIVSRPLKCRSHSHSRHTPIPCRCELVVDGAVGEGQDDPDGAWRVGVIERLNIGEVFILLYFLFCVFFVEKLAPCGVVKPGKGVGRAFCVARDVGVSGGSCDRMRGPTGEDGLYGRPLRLCLSP